MRVVTGTEAVFVGIFGEMKAGMVIFPFRRETHIRCKEVIDTHLCVESKSIAALSPSPGCVNRVPDAAPEIRGTCPHMERHAFTQGHSCQQIDCPGGHR